MSAVNGAVRVQSSAVARLLVAPRYEVIPVNGIEEKVAALPLVATVTVTASPRHGIERTLDVSARLAGRGYRVVPHLAARMIADRGQLERIVADLEVAGIHEAFVVGGDLEVSHDAFELAAVRNHARGQGRHDPVATPGQARA